MREASWCIFLALAAGCASPPPASHPPEAREAPPSASPRAADAPSPTEVLAEDKPLTTAAGDAFIAPARWSVSRAAGRVLLEAPEGNLRLALVQLDAADADAAARAAWKQLDPTMNRVARVHERYPGRDGWSERRELEYATSPNERLVVTATARRREGTWTVLLVHGDHATFHRRQAAIQLVTRSLRPKGYQRESLAGKKPHRLDAARIAEITAFVERARRDAAVPGVAIALVQDDAVVFEGGFGVRELGKSAKVDADTLFQIASTTKALTTLLLATLVDDGKLAWDAPAASVYPPFKLGDADTTRRVLVKHLLCACTGMPRKDFITFFEYGRATPANVFQELAATRPTTAFGETHQYSNTLAAAAGFIGGHVAAPGRELGAAYDEAMRVRVFEPLGMRATTFDVARALRQNHATPHAQDLQGNTAVGALPLLPSLSYLRPTGGAWSSVRDLAKYVRMELARGLLPSGKRMVSERNLLERRKKQIAMDADTFHGMGLRVRTDWGIPVVFHPGSYFGVHAYFFFVPDHGIGGVILTNGDDGHFLRAPFVRRVIEVAFDAQPQAAEDLENAAKDNRLWIARERAGLVLPPDEAAVAALAGRYQSDELGELTVRKTPGGVTFDFGEWSSPMATRKNADGTTTFGTTKTGLIGFEFVAAERGGRRALLIRESQYEYAFVEVGDAPIRR
jgi:CubicO group peptidase (beta-lactamase class C family)